MSVKDKALKKDDPGEFIEARAKNVMDPSPAIPKFSISDENHS